MASSSLVLSGGRKRSMPLKEMFANGLLKEGELLRYKARQELGAIGWAYAGGIKVPGKEGLLGCTAFEGHAGSKLHRPYEHIYTAAGVSLQELIMGVSSSQPASREGSPAAGRPGDQNAYGRAGALADPEVTLLEGHDDPNDEFCRMCTGDGFDGDLVCCETCPATFHFAPECLDIAAVPEGDWYCPMCRCVRCGHGTFAPPLQLPQQVLWLPSPEDQVTDASAQPLPVVHYPRDAVRAATAVKMEADSGGIQLEAAAKGKQKKRKLEEPAPLGDDGAALPAGIDAFLDLARAVANPAALLAALQERLPSAMGSAKKAQPLKDLFAALVPGSAFSGRNSALAAISKRLWELRNAPALLQMPGRLWWCSAGCERVSRGMAEAAGSGPQACHSQHLDAPLSWQLIRSTALSEPQACRGYAPQYTPGQAAQLKQVLLAARHILSESFEPLPDARVSMDLVPLLLQGKVTPERALDFGGAHVAVLWAGGSIASVAVVRALAAEFGEVILLASRPELHGNGLASEQHSALCFCQKSMLQPGSPGNHYSDPPAHVPRQVSPTGWGTAVGYTWPAMPLRLEMCAFPAMQFPGLPTLHKPLSEKSVALSQPRAGLGRVLTANPGFDLQPHLRSGLLAAVSGSLGPARPAQQAAKPPLAPKPARKATPLGSP
ncbi:hypothetical protein WJX72_007039 [[Myrmecia] bisecta]|uniref:Zinc finger PHD-type domain-containing protein n=1 Tax=[Myrmecia] bisecta TaxID=41462 RepID=A0AAW1Q485_9CHLO